LPRRVVSAVVQDPTPSVFAFMTHVVRILRTLHALMFRILMSSEHLHEA